MGRLRPADFPESAVVSGLGWAEGLVWDLVEDYWDLVGLIDPAKIVLLLAWP